MKLFRIDENIKFKAAISIFYEKVPVFLEKLKFNYIIENTTYFLFQVIH